jgi:hypothetical protein
LWFNGGSEKKNCSESWQSEFYVAGYNRYVMILFDLSWRIAKTDHDVRFSLAQPTNASSTYRPLLSYALSGYSLLMADIKEKRSAVLTLPCSFSLTLNSFPLTYTAVNNYFFFLLNRMKSLLH